MILTSNSKLVGPGLNRGLATLTGLYTSQTTPFGLCLRLVIAKIGSRNETGIFPISRFRTSLAGEEVGRRRRRRRGWHKNTSTFSEMSRNDSKYFSTTKKGEIPELKEELNSQYKVLRISHFWNFPIRYSQFLVLGWQIPRDFQFWVVVVIHRVVSFLDPSWGTSYYCNTLRFMNDLIVFLWSRNDTIWVAFGVYWVFCFWV